MLKSRIEQYFRQYPHLRVLFFFDELKEFEDLFENLELDNIRKVKFDSRNFHLKVMIHGQWANDKLFLYFQQPEPVSQHDYHHFPLLGELVANKVLYLDNVADFMDQYQLGQNQRALVNRFKKELQYASVQKLLAPILNRDRFDEPEVVKGLFSHFLGFKKIENWELLLARLLCLSLPANSEELDRFLKKVSENNLQEALAKPIRDYFKTTIAQPDQKEIAGLANRLKYNLITQTLDEKPADPYKSLKIKDGTVLAMLGSLCDTALNTPKLAEQFTGLLESETSQIKDETILQLYGFDADYGYHTQAMKWKILASGISGINTQPLAALALFERVSMLGSNTGQLTHTLKFLLYLAELIRQLNEIPGFILDTPDEYVEKYTEEFYRIDQHYRKAIAAYRKVDSAELPEYLQLDALKELLDDRYESFLEKLNREWLCCCAEKGFPFKELAVQKQYEFIRKEIKPYEVKNVVIISDALRYEAARSLLSQMHADSKNEAVIRHQLASIPSTTQFGMANLLAVKDIQLQGTELSIGGVTTEGLPNRQKILKNITEDALAFSFAEIAGNSQAVNREIFKSSLVFIYHDNIDAVGDKRPSERNAFNAVSETITEIAALVKKLHSSFNVSRVLITADHGFLYNDRTIKEADKQPLNEEATLWSHNRYAIVKNNDKQDLGYKIPLRQTTPIDSDLTVLFPKSVNRYKKQGVGHQFVHGGASLQELVVPIIESTRKRVDVVTKVNPRLISRNLRVVSSILRIQILQEHRVSKTEKEREIRIGLYRDSELISNQVAILLNATSELPSERNFACELMLRGDIGSVSLMYLKIYDKEDSLNPLIIQEVINNTLIEPDF